MKYQKLGVDAKDIQEVAVPMSSVQSCKGSTYDRNLQLLSCSIQT